MPKDTLMLETKSVEAVSIREYQPGEYIVREGASNEFFYVILQGQVQIYQLEKHIRVLNEKDIFGLENYFRNIPYSTSAKALNVSRVSKYRCEQLEDITYANPGMIDELLKSAYLQLEQTTSIAEANIPGYEMLNLTLVEYEDGDIIIEEGTYGTEIFRLYQTEGGLEVQKNNKKIALISNTGEFFGEMSFILNEPRNATIRSIGKSIIEVIPVLDGNLEKQLSENPEMANKMITILAQRLKEANSLLTK